MKKFLIGAAAILALSSSAQAYDRNSLLIGLGVDNLRDSTSDGNTGYQDPAGRLEFRGKAFNDFLGSKEVSPMGGIDVATNGSVYGFAGLLYDWNFYESWSLVPNIGMGLYSHGDGKDLGGTFEFHDSIELNYKLSESTRIGAELTHMSNASIYSHNPGKEDVMVTYTLGL